MKKNPHPNLLRALLGVFLLASLSYWIAGVLDTWEMERHADQHVAAPLDYNDDTGFVNTVRPEAKAVGIAPGVKITGLNGAPYTGDAQVDEILYTARPGDTVDVEFVRPDGSRGMGTITLARHAPPHVGIADWVAPVARWNCGRADAAGMPPAWLLGGSGQAPGPECVAAADSAYFSERAVD